MLVEVLEPAADGLRIGLAGVGERLAAVHLERAHRGHQHRAARREAAITAVDVEELLGPQLEREAGLRDHRVGMGERHARGGDGVRAVRDVGERSAVDERRHPFHGLHEIGLHRVLEQRGHRADRARVGGEHRRAVRAKADHDAREPLLEIGNAGGEAEDRHHLAGRRDVEARLARHAFAAATEADHYVAQRAIVHVERAPPQHASRVEAERIAVMQAVVHDRGQQIVSARDRVDVPREMEVDVFSRHHLRLAPARAAALHPEIGAERRLAQRRGGAHADQREPLSEPDRGGGLAFACGSRRHRRDEDQAAAGLAAVQSLERDLRLVMAVGLEMRR